MDKIYFLTGSQFLYGDEALLKVRNDAEKIASYFNAHLKNVEIIVTDLCTTSEAIETIIKQANYDDDVIGVMAWMHTFSPSKMWIRGLKLLQKPYLHLHTQANKEIPYPTIDMDFMNLNQSAHGDKEHSFILTRMHINREIAIGYYQDSSVLKKIQSWVDVIRAYKFSKHLNIVRFGDNMRDVAVTEGDKVEAEIVLGWSCNTYAVGDLVSKVAEIKDEEVEATFHSLTKKYILNTENIHAVNEQIKYYLAMKKFFALHKASAFSNTFEDLYGMEELPGLATQLLMDEGIGYAGEGDWKTAALDAVIMKLAEGRKGATGFMEDYTYDFEKECVLGAHMLEVSPRFAETTPKIEVHPLSIGGKQDPARLVFEGTQGDGYALSLIDLGTHFRLIAQAITLIKEEESMPNLPVASIMWKIRPTFKDGVKAWLLAGGAHHSVVTTQVSLDEIKMLANLYNLELIVIDEHLDMSKFEREINK